MIKEIQDILDDLDDLNLNNLDNEILKLQNTINKRIQKLNKLAQRVFWTNLEFNEKYKCFDINFNNDVPWNTRADKIDAKFDLIKLNYEIQVLKTYYIIKKKNDTK